MFQTEIQTGLVTGDHIPLLSLLLFISSVDLVWKEESLGWEDLLLHLPLLQALLWSRWKLCKSWRKLSWPTLLRSLLHSAVNLVSARKNRSHQELSSIYLLLLLFPLFSSSVYLLETRWELDESQLAAEVTDDRWWVIDGEYALHSDMLVTKV